MAVNDRLLIEVYQPKRDCHACGEQLGDAIATIAIVGDFEVSYGTVPGYEIFSRKVGHERR